MKFIYAIVMIITSFSLTGCFGEPKEATALKEKFLSYSFQDGSLTMGEFLEKRFHADQKQLLSRLEVDVKKKYDDGRVNWAIIRISNLDEVYKKNSWIYKNHLWWESFEPMAGEATALFSEQFKMEPLDDKSTLIDSKELARQIKDSLNKEIPGLISGDLKEIEALTFRIQSTSGKEVGLPTGGTVLIPDLSVETGFLYGEFLIVISSDKIRGDKDKIIKITSAVLSANNAHIPWSHWMNSQMPQALGQVLPADIYPGGKCLDIETGCRTIVKFGPLSWLPPLQIIYSKTRGLWISNKKERI